MKVEIRKVAVLTDDSGHETVISDQQVVTIVEAALAKEADNKSEKKPLVRKPAKAKTKAKEQPEKKYSDVLAEVSKLAAEANLGGHRA